MNINFNELVESFISSFIEQCQEELLPRDEVEEQMYGGSPFYHIAFPKHDLYGLLKANALKFYYLCRGREEETNYEFIKALVKINPGHEYAVLQAYQQPRHVCKQIADEGHLNNVIGKLQDDFGSHSGIIHYDHVCPK